MLPDPKPDMSALPAHILKRFFRKSSTWDSKPENSEYLRHRVNEIPKRYGEYDELVEDYTLRELRECGIGKLADYIWLEDKKMTADVLEILKAARVIANYVEYDGMYGAFQDDVSEKIRERLYDDMKKFYHLPHFIEIAEGLGEYRGLRKLFNKIAFSGRNTDRWQGFGFLTESSILAHMYETALISYLANLETGRETDILQDFWVMMFHDMPEVWTDDIPSPVKDNMEVAPGIKLRSITEDQERYVMEKYFYPVIPEKCVSFFRDGVMLEDVDDQEKRRFYKMADYFSADFEVYRNIRKGTRNGDFYKVLCKSLNPEKYRTPAQREWITEKAKRCEGIVFLD